MGASDSVAKHFTVSWLETNLSLLLGFVPVWVGLPYSFMATCHLGARGCSSLSCGALYVTPVGLVSLAGDPRFPWRALAQQQGCSEAALCPLHVPLILPRRCKAKPASRGEKDLAYSMELVKPSPKGKTWEDTRLSATSGLCSQEF